MDYEYHCLELFNKRQKFLKLHFKYKELDDDEMEINSKKEFKLFNSINEQEAEYQKYKLNNDNSNDDGDCSCNNDLKQIINGRIFYFSKKVYHKAIKVMNEYEFNQFIKFCSYRSFIQFLYSYGIKAKLLLRYYYLINHVLLYHNHYRQINQSNSSTTSISKQMDEDLKFISNYWDTVFKFYPLKQKTIISYQKIMKSNKINSPILDQLLSNYKLIYDNQYYHYDCKHNKGPGFNKE